MKIFIIGSGTFGTAIANELSRDIDNEVVIFSRSKEIKDEINNCLLYTSDAADE